MCVCVGAWSILTWQLTSNVDGKIETENIANQRQWKKKNHQQDNVVLENDKCGDFTFLNYDQMIQ